MGGGAEIFEFLAGEDVDGDEMDLGVAVLAGLGGGHVDDLAGTVLDADKTVLSQSGTLHGVGGRGASIDALKGVLMLRRERSAKSAQQCGEKGSSSMWGGKGIPTKKGKGCVPAHHRP